MSLNSLSAAGAAGAAIAPFAIKDLIVASKSSIFAGAPVGNSARACGTMLKNWFVIVLSVCDVTVPGLNIALRICNRNPLSAVICVGVGVTPVAASAPNRALSVDVVPHRAIDAPPARAPLARIANSSPGTGRHASCSVSLRCVHTPIDAHAASAHAPPTTIAVRVVPRVVPPRARPRPSPRASPSSPSSAAVSARSTSRSSCRTMGVRPRVRRRAVRRPARPASERRPRASRRPRLPRASRPASPRVPRPAPSCARRLPRRTSH